MQMHLPFSHSFRNSSTTRLVLILAIVGLTRFKSTSVTLALLPDVSEWNTFTLLFQGLWLPIFLLFGSRLSFLHFTCSSFNATQIYYSDVVHVLQFSQVTNSMVVDCHSLALQVQALMHFRLITKILSVHNFPSEASEEAESNFLVTVFFAL